MLLIAIMNPCVRCISVRLRVGYERSSNAQFGNEVESANTPVPQFPPQTWRAFSARSGIKDLRPRSVAWGAPGRAHGTRT